MEVQSVLAFPVTRIKIQQIKMMMCFMIPKMKRRINLIRLREFKFVLL